jgi:hypothetical protein
MRHPRYRVIILQIALLIGLLPLPFTLSGCHPPSRTASLERGDSLPQRVARRLAETGRLRDAERVLLAERARGEEGRARLLMEVLWTYADAAWRTDLLSRLSDIQRPDRPPWIEQELGLEPHPPLLSSSAAPEALARIASALSGQGFLPDLLRQAEVYQHGGEFIEAAGVMTLAQLVLENEGSTEPMRTQVKGRWRQLADRRRCVAQIYDAAQPRGRLLNPGGERAVDLVLQGIKKEPSRLPCAAIALQLASTQPALGGRAGWAARALMSPILITAQYASLDLLSTQRATPGPVVREARSLQEALRQGMGRYLHEWPSEGWRLLPLLGQDPGGTLARDRLDDVVLRSLYEAPSFPDGAERIRWAFRRRFAVVASDPLRYVAYMEQLGPEWAPAVVDALREPDPEVLARATAALSAYPIEQVEQALEGPMESRPGSIGAAEERRHRQVLRALFRLPLPEATAKEAAAARQTALDLHRCCRGNQGSCDRLQVSTVRRCPVWTPLRWW